MGRWPEMKRIEALEVLNGLTAEFGGRRDVRGDEP